MDVEILGNCPDMHTYTYTYRERERKEGNVLFNDALNTFYLRLYGASRERETDGQTDLKYKYGGIMPYIFFTYTFDLCVINMVYYKM